MILVWSSSFVIPQISLKISLIMYSGVNWGLQVVLYLGGSLNNFRVSRTHGLSYYISFSIELVRVVFYIITGKYLGFFFSIGIWGTSANKKTIFLVYRSFLFCMAWYTYHVNSHAFFAKRFFSVNITWKDLLSPPNLIWWGRSCLDLQGVKRTWRPIADIFELSPKYSSQDLHECCQIPWKIFSQPW